MEEKEIHTITLTMPLKEDNLERDFTLGSPLVIRFLCFPIEICNTVAKLGPTARRVVEQPKSRRGLGRMMIRM